MRSAADLSSSLPGETIGSRGGERVILDAVAHGAYEARGSIEEWRDGVAKLASGHVLPVLAISAALAGPLLHLAGRARAAASISSGQSSKGKTTLLQLAASVWGRGERPAICAPGARPRTAWRARRPARRIRRLILDEVGQVEARELWRQRSIRSPTARARREPTRDGALREPRSWRVLTISSGEVPVDAKLI